MVQGFLLVLSHRFHTLGEFIERMTEKQSAPLFLVAGGLLQASDFLQKFRPDGYELDQEDYEPEREVDLSYLGKNDGEYELKFKSGFFGDGSDEDRLAFSENIYELTLFVLNNLTFKVYELGEDADCVAALVDLMKHSALTKLTYNPDENIIKSVMIPTLGNLANVQDECMDGSAWYKFLAKIVKYVELWNNQDEYTNAFQFYPQWVSTEKEITACQYWGQDQETKKYRTSNCFVFERVDTIKAQNFPGDTS